MSVNLNTSDFPLAWVMGGEESFEDINPLPDLSDQRISESAHKILFNSPEESQDDSQDFEIDDPEGLLTASFLNLENDWQRNFLDIPQQMVDIAATIDVQTNVLPDLTGILKPGYYHVEEFYLSYLCEMNVITPNEKLEIVLAYLREMEFKIHPVDFDRDPIWISDGELAKYIPENLKVYIVEFDKWVVANTPNGLLLPLPSKYASPDKERKKNKGKISIWDQDALVVYNAGLILAELFPNLKRNHPVLYDATRQVNYKITSIASTIHILENVKAKWNIARSTKELIISIS